MRHRYIWISALLAVGLVSCSSGSAGETTTTTSPATTTTESPATTTTTANVQALDPETATWCDIRQESYEYDMDDPAALEAAMTQTLAFLLARTEAPPAEIADAVQIRADEFASWVDALRSADFRLDDLPEPELITPERQQEIQDADDAVLAFELEYCGFDSRVEGPVGN